MRRFLLAASLTATVLFSASVVRAETTTNTGCPEVDKEIRECEANNMKYETYVDANQCKRAKCIESVPACPTDGQLEEYARKCEMNGKTPEKFNDGRCTIIRCSETNRCPTENQMLEQITRCKNAGYEYDYVEKGGCKVVECMKTETCPSNLDLDRMATMCKEKGGTPEFYSDGTCRRIKCGEGTCNEQEGFRMAYWQCYDGFEQKEGGESSCKPSDLWRRYAEDVCKGRCSKETGKCGVNSFSVEWACGGANACDTPTESCPSMEANQKTAESCTERGGRPFKSWDKNKCMHIQCDTAALEENADSCTAMRQRVSTVCETEGEERCREAKQQFLEKCPPPNYRPEADRCKEIRAKLVAMKNAGLTETDEFGDLSRKFAEYCLESDDARPVPPAGHDEEVLDEESCGDYDNPYPDVDQCSEEGKAAVELYRRDIATGMPDGEFDGDAPLNRAQTAKFLLRACNLNEDEQFEGDGAPDIDDTQWYAPLIRAAMGHGVILGNPDGTVRPGNTVNHAEFTAMLMRACYIDPTGWPVCADDVSSEDWFAAGAAVAEAYDLYPDSGGVFDGGALQTREETAVAIYQYLKNRDAAPVSEADDSCFLIPEAS